MPGLILLSGSLAADTTICRRAKVTAGSSRPDGTPLFRVLDADCCFSALDSRSLHPERGSHPGCGDLVGLAGQLGEVWSWPGSEVLG
jgi:hypothetical protein